MPQPSVVNPVDPTWQNNLSQIADIVATLLFGNPPTSGSPSPGLLQFTPLGAAAPVFNKRIPMPLRMRASGLRATPNNVGAPMRVEIEDAAGDLVQRAGMRPESEQLFLPNVDWSHRFRTIPDLMVDMLSTPFRSFERRKNRDIQITNRREMESEAQRLWNDLLDGMGVERLKFVPLATGYDMKGKGPDRKETELARSRLFKKASRGERMYSKNDEVTVVRKPKEKSANDPIQAIVDAVEQLVLPIPER